MWNLIHKYDNRSYTFGTFDRVSDDGFVKNCILIVIYKDKRIVGFCSLSIYVGYSYNYITEKHDIEQRHYSIDVWVKPYYRDMGLGSILVNKANEICMLKFGKLPKGSDKNHTHCWDIRFRKDKLENDKIKEKRYLDAIRKPVSYSQLEAEEKAQQCLFTREWYGVIRTDCYENIRQKLIVEIIKNNNLDLYAIKNIVKSFGSYG